MPAGGVKIFVEGKSFQFENGNKLWLIFSDQSTYLIFFFFLLNEWGQTWGLGRTDAIDLWRIAESRNSLCTWRGRCAGSCAADPGALQNDLSVGKRKGSKVVLVRPLHFLRVRGRHRHELFANSSECLCLNICEVWHYDVYRDGGWCIVELRHYSSSTILELHDSCLEKQVCTYQYF